eukprot:TRINITY_DN1425_c0_g1_i2.p1 TRINITY_DN1425_c0_g1~~TRINITY_DN1425_c0_g1_i2.p1  ORF type:complete len:242 (+),score=44.03 TRINITY_DN1425_c0_g1_i2:464-1189(+)
MLDMIQTVFRVEEPNTLIYPCVLKSGLLLTSGTEYLKLWDWKENKCMATISNENSGLKDEFLLQDILGMCSLKSKESMVFYHKSDTFILWDVDSRQVLCTAKLPDDWSYDYDDVYDYENDNSCFCVSMKEVWISPEQQGGGIIALGVMKGHTKGMLFMWNCVMGQDLVIVHDDLEGEPSKIVNLSDGSLLIGGESLEAATEGWMQISKPQNNLVELCCEMHLKARVMFCQLWKQQQKHPQQ